MDFLDALRVLRRRWAVLLVGVLLTVGAGAWSIVSVPTQYQAGAQYLLLLPAGSTGSQSPTNPYINMPGGLVFAATLIGSDMSTAAEARSLVEDGFESEYSVKQGPSGGPLLEVLVEGTDGRDVLETRDELLERFDRQLDSLQDITGIPSNQLIFSRTNAVDPIAEVVPGAKKKALVLVAVLGVVVTLVLAFLIDGLLRRRSRSKAT